MTSPESGSREPTYATRERHVAAWERGHTTEIDHANPYETCPGCAEVRAIESEAVERFAEALVRAVTDVPAHRWREPDLVSRAAVLAAISALRSPTDTGEHQEGDVGS